MNRLFVSPEAQKDLFEIKKYISEELENPKAAIRIVLKITKKLRGLIDFPEVRTMLSSIINFESNYHFIICESYIAFYRIDKNSIYIDRILYGKRDFIKVLFENIDNTQKKME